MTLRIGVDLGGTKIEVIALDLHGVTRWRHRVATPSGQYDATITAITALVANAELEGARANAGTDAKFSQLPGQRASVGVGIPGAISRRDGRVKNANSTVLNGRLLKQDLEAALQREVRIENDANCFAMSEASDGAGAGFAMVFGVILGTGVGGGLVISGQLVRGADAITGEWGHLPLPTASQIGAPTALRRQLADDEHNTRTCYCGRVGCVETWLSGPALAADYVRSRKNIAGPGETAIDAAQVVRLAQSGEPLAVQSLDRYIDRLARSLAMVVNIVDPDVIVLGGGLSNMSGLPERLKQALPPYVFSDQLATAIRVNQHGDSSGVRGAAWLWPV